MGSVEKANEAAEKVAKTTQDSYQSMVEHGAGLQERNVRFMQEMVEGSVKELRYQAESNRAITQQLIERAEKQRDAVQTLFEESLDAYMDLLYSPLTHYKQSLEAAKKAAR
jgi:transcriptional regulator of heat shock response